MVAGMLAIVQVGAAYVPLDRDYPPPALDHIINDTGLQLVLTTLDRAPWSEASRVDVMRITARVIDDANPTLSPIGELGDQLSAYVLYTSGSTGTPKGIEISHRNVVRLVYRTDFVLIDGDDVFTQASNHAFDAMTLEVWGALVNGARLIHVDRDVLLDSRRFPLFLRENAVSKLFLTVALFNQLAEHDPTALESVHDVMFGGETANPDAVRKVFEQGKPARLMNAYGPTENTTFSTWYEVRTLADTVHCPIGWPVSRSTAHVVDSLGGLVPRGTVGELVVAGDGVAHGYVGRPDLTAERFVPDAFATRPGQRLYRTGDLVRRNMQGVIEFVGRTDHQVKLRGFRIEPGEIEARLHGCAGVEQAVVVVRHDQADDPRLVAYVAGASDVEALRASLEQSLPAYMVPSAFVLLEAMPLTANGKIDRQSLPAPAYSAGEAEYVAPRSHEESLLASLWQELLGVDQVGIHDSFFVLGGHSLLATRLIARLRADSGIELPIRALFETPTVAGLAARLEYSEDELPALEALPEDGPRALSYAQQRLWFLEQLGGADSSYNIPSATRLKGALDLGLLRRSLQALVDRHAVFRTRIEAVDGEPVQLISAHWRLPVTVIDVSGLPTKLRESQTRRLARADASRAFDLAAGGLLRVSVVRESSRRHVMLLCMHHIISDGWSMGVFTAEFGALLAAFSAGSGSSLPALPVQYADYAHWQRQWLSGETLERQFSFWESQLSGLPPVLELPTDRPRPAQRQYRGARVGFRVPARLRRELESLGGRLGATPFMVLLASFEVLLARYSGQWDFALGTPVANRTQAEVEHVIGFFVNTLVLRSDVAGEREFEAVVEAVKARVLAAYSHQDLPFEQLVDRLNPERSLSHSPLFQVMFTLELASQDDAMAWPGMSLESVPTGDAERVKFDLSLGLRAEGEELVGGFEFDADLFAVDTLAGWAENYLHLLEAIVDSPRQAVGRLPLLPAPAAFEEHLAVPECGIIDLIDAQVAATPDAIALVVGEQAWSYATLAERMNALASGLAQRGVGVEDRVGVCLGRGLDMLASLLAILKSGASYVPLDPNYPIERLAWIVEDAHVLAVLTERSSSDRVPAGVPLWPVETLGSDVVFDAIACDPRQLAYLIYTSGSTGRPKGVALSHGNAVAFLSWARTAFDAADVAGMLASTSMCFDLSVFELFLPLSVGGTVMLAEDALELPRLPLREAVTLVNTVPSALEALLAGKGIPDGVRVINLAGEPLSSKLAGEIHKRHQVRLYNLYGPSEDTTYSTWSQVAPGSDKPLIGMPIANTRAHVLDPQGQPVPSGAIGELYIGGAGVARGYFDRPDLTAERFVPDAFATQPGQRLYRTGDRVRYTHEGALDYLGRTDHQVKLRGFRIEPGEIEARLHGCAGVEQAVVVVRHDQADDPRLVAYVAGASDVEALRASLEQSLPAYMVPSAFVLLEAMPLTANGKIDRQSLPAPAYSAGEAEYVAPRSHEESLLASLWQELLGVDQVGIHDSFFVLGGHSLLAMKLLAEIQKRTACRLTPIQVFLHPTVAGLAPLLKQGAVSESESLVTLRRGDSDAPALYCIPGLGGNASDFLALARTSKWEGEVLALQPTGFGEGEVAATSISEMAKVYLEAIAERGAFAGVLVGHSMGGLVALQMAAKLAPAGAGQTVVLLDTQPYQNAHASSRPPDEVDALLAYFERHGGRPGSLLDKDLRSMKTKRRMRVVLARMKLQGLSVTGDLTQFRRVIKVYEAHLRAMQSFRFPKIHQARVVHVAPYASAAIGNVSWPSSVNDRLERHLIAGGHLSMLQQPFVSGLSACMCSTLGNRGDFSGLHSHMQRLARQAVQASAEERLAHANAEAGVRGYRQRHRFGAELARLLPDKGFHHVLDVGGSSDNARLPVLENTRVAREPWLPIDLAGAEEEIDKSTHDIVAALGNGYSYCEPENLQRFFQRARARLRPGGLLLMDVFGSRAFESHDSRIVRVQSIASGNFFGAAIDKVEDDGLVLMRLFATIGDDAKLNSPRVLRLHAHRPATISALLHKAGFHRVSFYSADGSKEVSDHNHAMLVLAVSDE
jgi:amino acid adenylation domain-containing protein